MVSTRRSKKALTAATHSSPMTEATASLSVEENVANCYVSRFYCKKKKQSQKDISVNCIIVKCLLREFNHKKLEVQSITKDIKRTSMVTCS